MEEPESAIDLEAEEAEVLVAVIASATGALEVVQEVAVVASAADQEGLVEAAPAPAAVEARRVWEEVAAAAVVLVVVAAVAAAEAAVVVVAVEGGSEMKRSTIMKSTSMNRKLTKPLTVLSLVSFSLLFFSAGLSLCAQTPTASTSNQRTFATTREAADELIDAAEKFDEAALSEILGLNSYDITHTGEPARDRENAIEFAKRARIKSNISQPKNSHLAYLLIGDDDWPFPVPMVKRGAKWAFDSDAGRTEILYRRIGGNEIDAIDICRGFVEAEHAYALEKHDGVNQYAQRIISTEGKQDGLAWKNADGTWGGPVGENVARVIERGYTSKKEPYHGYFFKVLTGQGPDAPLGEMDFLVKGVMIGGFALIATPAQYRVTGVKTFMVSHDGVVYQKDLGPNSLEIAKSIERFNPDKSWSPVLEQ